MEKNIDQSVKFKKFWVCSINNWIVDAGYIGKDLKAAHPIPTFRRFYFIKSWQDVRYFSLRDGYTNKELCEMLLSQSVLEEVNK